MASSCPVCNQKISGGSVEVQGKFLHPKCFFCDLCGKQCRTTNFKIENGKYRCVDCNNRNVGEPDSLESVAKCGVCNSQVTGASINLDGKIIHLKCFTCEKCGKQCQANNYKTVAGKPHCIDCNKAKLAVVSGSSSADQLASLCAVCGYQISGASIGVDGGLLHIKCFFCNACGRQCRANNVKKDKHGKYCCRDCTDRSLVVSGSATASELIDLCTMCGYPITGASIEIDGAPLHKKCFFCDKCAKPCRVTNYKVENGKYRCIDCSGRNVVVSGSSSNDQLADICAACNRQISGASIAVNDQLYHKNCFFCNKCAKQCRINNYKVVKGKFQCIDCSGRTAVAANVLKSSLTDICSVCSLQITGKSVDVDGKVMHTKCFTCSKCAKQCRVTNYKVEGGKICCIDCDGKGLVVSGSAGTTATICSVCNHQISGQSVDIEGKLLHPQCFTCKRCGKQCRVTNYKVEGGKYRCIDCSGRSHVVSGASKNRGTEDLCPVCNYPVTGGGVDIDDRKLHPKCFFCQKCSKTLRLGNFDNVDSKFYCQPCVDKDPTLYHKARQQRIKPKPRQPQPTTTPTKAPAAAAASASASAASADETAPSSAASSTPLHSTPSKKKGLISTAALQEDDLEINPVAGQGSKCTIM